MDFHKLAAPADDGAILVEPPPGQWPALIERNIAARAGDLRLAGTTAAAEREAVRRSIAPLNPAQPIIAAGHQPAFVHPGVWAKHVAVHAMARRLHVQGLDFVVDNDAPTAPDLVIPVVERDGLITTRLIRLAPAPAGSSYEGRPALSADDLERIRTEVADALGPRLEDSCMPAYLAGLGAPADDLVAQHLAGRARVDGPLEADLTEVRVSRAFGGAFVADLLLHAERFAGAYNHALAEYRLREEVRSPNRPLPNLGRENGRVETALWTYSTASGPQLRRRLWIAHGSDRVMLYAGAQEIGVIAAHELLRDPNVALRELEPWVVRPRALTLTLWARLLACDLFVHGIGGAKYDRITDAILRTYYRIEPPAYACVTATLRLPLPTFDVADDDLRAARARVRDARFNPQRYLENLPSDLLGRRRELIAASRAARERRAPRLERRAICLDIRAVNDQLLSSDGQLPSRLEEAVARTSVELASNEFARSREYFYALQPRTRLDRLADGIRGAVDGARLPA